MRYQSSPGGARRVVTTISAALWLVLSARAALGVVLQGNILVNGGGDAAASGFPGWTLIAGTTEVLSWAGNGGTSTPGPPDRGLNFFAGGCCAVTSQIRQSVDVSSAASQIDAGAVSFAFSGYFGGFGGQDNNATLTIIFRDGSNGALGSPVTIGGVLAADRGNITGLLLRSTSGSLPASTRSIQVDLLQTGDGFYNDGYADSLSLVLLADDAKLLNVDRAKNGVLSDGNGVFEPGETVFIEPSWTNPTAGGLAASGAASSFTGPPPSDYTIDDAAASYGTIGAGATANCFTASSNCYQMSISEPLSRPTTHWDATFSEALTTGDPAKSWTLHVGDSFTDVPRSEPFYKRIETLLHTGITSGCTATTYCPGDVVNRGSMAIFIAKGIAGSGPNVPTSGTVSAQPYNCAPAGNSLFTDVLPTDIFCKHVHYIAAQNVTLGCATGMYCPSGNISRLEMASFIAKATVAPGGGPSVPQSYGPDPVTGFSYSCNPSSPAIHFTDVPASNSFCKHVHYLWAKGIISGCGATTYCPGDPVTRDAMAKFLTNAFNLLLYGP